MRLILASASPRRAEILRRAGFVFEVLPAEVDETRHANESPEEYVKRLAQEKAVGSAERVQDAAAILGADTTVNVDGMVLGKPADAVDAAAMLRKLSGRTHEVLTGLALLLLPRRAMQATVTRTHVTFTAMSDVEIADYVASGEPFGKAGGYAIQERGSRFVERIEGDYFNVVGLPVAQFYIMWKEMAAPQHGKI
jgi:septum formation protein